MAVRIQQRRDSTSGWNTANPILAHGEIGVNIDNWNYKIGDGVTAWNDLPYIGNPPNTIIEIIGNASVDSSSVDFTYDQNAHTITAAVLEAGVNHNLLMNCTGNEHIDHSLVSIQGTDGLTGGGAINTNQTISMPDVATAGTYGSSSATPVITLDAKGRVTSATPTNISIPSSAVSDFNTSVVAALPSQTGNADKFLKTDGSSLSWDTASGGGGGATKPNIISVGGYVPGLYYDNQIFGVASTTLALGAGVLDVVPFMVWKDVSIDQIGVNRTAGAGTAQIVIYSTNTSTGWPETLLYKSATIANAAGYMFASLSFTFLAGVTYWIGVHRSASLTISTVPTSCLPELGLVTATGTAYYATLRQTVTYGNAPQTWTFSPAQLTNSAGPSIRFRVAGPSGDPYYSSVKVMVPFSGDNGSTTFLNTTIVPVTLSHSVNGVITAVSTAQKAYGTSSAHFTGADSGGYNGGCLDVSDYSAYVDNSLYKSFTMEMWIYPETNSIPYQMVFELPINIGLYIRPNGGGISFQWWNNASNNIISSAHSLNTWHHVAITRDMTNNTSLFVNGIKQGTTDGASSNNHGVLIFNIGSNHNHNECFTGYLQGLRITDLVERYTSNFTPVQAEYPA